LLRIAKSLSQEEASYRAGLDPKHWSAIEHSSTNPTVATLLSIAYALDVELAELFAGI
jgi:transcriptional regulator with XRE-family HTH domain